MNARHGGGDGVRHDEEGLVGRGAAQHAVRTDGKQKADRKAEEGHERREGHRDLEARDIVRVGQKRFKVLKTHEFRAEPEGILHQHRLVDGLAGGQEEEDERNGELRRHQQVGQPAVLEYDSFFHVVDSEDIKNLTASIPQDGRAVCPDVFGMRYRSRTDAFRGSRASASCRRKGLVLTSSRVQSGRAARCRGGRRHQGPPWRSPCRTRSFRIPRQRSCGCWAGSRDECRGSCRSS